MSAPVPTDEQINQIQDDTGVAIWGSAEVAIRAAFRLGMLKAAEIALAHTGSSDSTINETARSIADDIRAAAGE